MFEQDMAKLMGKLNDLFTEAVNADNAIDVLKAIDLDKNEKLVQFTAYVNFFIEHKLC